MEYPIKYSSSELHPSRYKDYVTKTKTCNVLPPVQTAVPMTKKKGCKTLLKYVVEKFLDHGHTSDDLSYKVWLY